VRVERLRTAFEIDIQFVQFPLHPETPAEGLTLQELFAGRQIDLQAAQERMARLMAEEGLDYGPRSMTFNSRLAQELAKWAEAQPGGEAIHDALFRAYFVRGENLAVIENLVAIAETVGLNGGDARAVLDSRRFKGAVDADWQHCRELGVTGVPTFVIGTQGLMGAQPYEVLAEFVTTIGAKARHG
jgi:predicted DsbA family dithiol-disulfide isomerase